MLFFISNNRISNLQLVFIVFFWKDFIENEIKVPVIKKILVITKINHYSKRNFAENHYLASILNHKCKSAACLTTIL